MYLDALKQFNDRWALLTAGTARNYNTMTISWGGLGTLWSRPVAAVYVKPIRHTFGFLEANDFFTVSFYPSAYKQDLAILGSRSGRDGDKVALTGLTPKPLDKGMTFAQAEVTLVCRKLYWQDLLLERIPMDAREKFYVEEPPHRMYIGEVADILS